MAMIAGPCSVESEEQVIDVAKAVKEAGANMLRGGAFKPRTSPSLSRDLDWKDWRCCAGQKKRPGFRS